VPTADNYVRQGVTTIIEGPDGGSPVPLKPFSTSSRRCRSPSTSAASRQGSVRQAVDRACQSHRDAEEVERMRGLVRQGMLDGAFGLSTGLFYVPGAFTPLAEVIELQRVVAPYRGVHTSHMRDEAGGVVDSVKETIAIGEQGGVPTQISHHKMIGKANWGKSAETLRLVDEARARGVDATIDQYPYTASSTSIQGALLPPWAQEGGRKEILQRLMDPETRAKIRAVTAISSVTSAARAIPECGADHLRVGHGAGGEESRAGDRGAGAATYRGERGRDGHVDRGAGRLPRGVSRDGRAGPAAHTGPSRDDDRLRRRGHDLRPRRPAPEELRHFRPLLAAYVREKRLITLEDAVRKMSAFPAARIGLTDRGVLREGMKADIAVFDPARVRDMATFEEPHQYAAGFSHVIVNGQVVYEGGGHDRRAAWEGALRSGQEVSPLMYQDD
jgi:dihydroorotase/N-acyl-D-amino-acid deacylase